VVLWFNSEFDQQSYYVVDQSLADCGVGITFVSITGDQRSKHESLLLSTTVPQQLWQVNVLRANATELIQQLSVDLRTETERSVITVLRQTHSFEQFRDLFTMLRRLLSDLDRR